MVFVFQVWKGLPPDLKVIDMRPIKGYWTSVECQCDLRFGEPEIRVFVVKSKWDPINT